MKAQAITYQQFEQLLKQNEAVLEQNQKLVQTVVDLVGRLDMSTKKWYTPDEALKALGCQITANGRRRLQYLRNKAFLTKFGSLKPFTYDAQQVKDIAEKLRAGEICLPTKF